MAGPRKAIDFEKLELLASMRRSGAEIAAALGISKRSFDAWRGGKGNHGPEFRRRYLAGRESARAESMGRVDIVLRALDCETVRGFIAAVIAQPVADTSERAYR